MKHNEKHPLAGQTVSLNDNVASDFIQGLVVPGAEYRIEDWADRVFDGSIWDAHGNFAALHYAARSAGGLPIDNDVVYGHIGHLGHAVHVSELGEPVNYASNGMNHLEESGHS
jgi:hypothetical protein